MAVKKEQAAAQRAEEFEGRELPFKKKPRGNLKAYHVRMYEGDWQALREHFEDLGTTVSSGLRQIVRAYMKEHGI